jgi:hypothetical protein
MEQILTGLLLGDGHCEKYKDISARFSIPMTNKEFLKWVNRNLDWLSLGVKEFREAGERKMFGTTADCKEMWSVRTPRHKGLRSFRDNWYVDKWEKRFPEGLELTPLVAKVWYCCDGSIGGNADRICFVSTAQSDRKEYFSKLFPYEIYQRNGLIILSTEDSFDMLDWMGKPLPGFEYKWRISHGRR